MLPAAGWTTARAKAVATAASTALPPAISTSIPTCEAIAFCDTTMPLRARTGTEPASARRSGRGHDDEGGSGEEGRAFMQGASVAGVGRTRLPPGRVAASSPGGFVV